MHFLFAWRYFRGKYAFQAIQIIAWVSVFAIALGTAALITVLSVSNGFTEVVKGLYSDFYADVRVTATHSKFFQISDTHYHAIKKMDGVIAISKVVENKALLVKGTRQSVVMVKGVDSNYAHINKISNYLKRGEFALGHISNPQIVVGIGVEQSLGLFQEPLGDTLQLYAVNRSGKSITQLDQLNTLSVVQSGAFSIQQEFDEQYIFTDDAFAQYLFDLSENEITGIELSIDPKKEKLIVASIQSLLGKEVQIQNKYQQNIDLYKIMQTEKWIIFFILALIMVVASFNLVGALTMLVLEKKKDIHVLHSMGASSWDIQKIFLLLSAVMAFMGAMIGGVLSSLFCWLQLKYHLIKLEGNSFVIDYYPVKPMVVDYIAIIGLVVFISILAGWIPARRAADSLHEKM
ncbi:MAG: ABC transporter permease [Bacteroidetes bacterium]|nr:ABC transporter permease [Bacteroidota bacterium]